MIPDKEILQNYINDNIPQWKIGEYFGVNQATVSNWFKKYGLKSKISEDTSCNTKCPLIFLQTGANKMNPVIIH